jgi:D-alanine-D-alanine ligase
MSVSCPKLAPVVYREEVKDSDREVVRKIISSSGFFSTEELEVAIELVEERLNKGLRSGYSFLFAETDRRVIGYSCFGRISCTRSSFDLYWIAVDEPCRGMGYGRKLLTKTEAKIVEEGASRIYVETSSRSQYEPTRLFYTHCGYVEEAMLKDFYGPGDDKFIYVKIIHSL